MSHKFSTEKQRKKVMMILKRKPFSKWEKYEVKQSVLVPSTDKTQKYVGDDEFNKRLKETETTLSRKFGGYTSINSKGGWLLKEKRRGRNKSELIKEKVGRVMSYADDKDFISKFKGFTSWLKHKKKEWGQKELSYEVEDDLYFVK